MIKQCQLCPWRVDADPHRIPNGYSVDKHKDLSATIAAGTISLRGGSPMMACHHSAHEEEFPCAGWLNNQVGPGNNLGLRMQLIAGQIDEFKVDGEQHATLEDTLPA